MVEGFNSVNMLCWIILLQFVVPYVKILYWLDWF